MDIAASLQVMASFGSIERDLIDIIVWVSIRPSLAYFEGGEDQDDFGLIALIIKLICLHVEVYFD
jgi:hypothetical protein